MGKAKILRDWKIFKFSERFTTSYPGRKCEQASLDQGENHTAGEFRYALRVLWLLPHLREIPFKQVFIEFLPGPRLWSRYSDSDRWEDLYTSKLKSPCNYSLEGRIIAGCIFIKGKYSEQPRNRNFYVGFCRCCFVVVVYQNLFLHFQRERVGTAS